MISRGGNEVMSERVSLHAAKEGARHRRTDKGEREKEREKRE